MQVDQYFHGNKPKEKIKMKINFKKISLAVVSQTYSL
jgi:hypothetical protein